MTYRFVKSPSVPNPAPGDILEMQDVHHGPFHIYCPDQGTLYCDIDGTLADIAHRRIYLEQQPKDWKRFKATLHLDTPVSHIITAVQRLHRAGWRIVLMTGRDASSLPVTSEWLARHNVPFDAMYMRPDRDYRRDDEVKADLFAQAQKDGFVPDVVFDDRDQVVAMWRMHELACVQVAEGNF